MKKDVPGSLALVPGSHCGSNAQLWKDQVLLKVPFGTAIWMDRRLVHGGRAYEVKARVKPAEAKAAAVHHRLHFYLLPYRAAAPDDEAQPAPLVFEMDTVEKEVPKLFLNMFN